MQEGTVLCFDFGLARTGVASGNTLTRSAQPVTIIHARTNDERWKAVEALVKEWEPVLLVVGVPRHGDGTDCDLTPRCERFARQLGGRFRLPVRTVDERFSSVMVEHGADKIDDEAAYYGTQLSIAEMLASGTVSFSDMYFLSLIHI